jgi:hypothetical protein
MSFFARRPLFLYSLKRMIAARSKSKLIAVFDADVARPTTR